jgi:hypothetical protein
LIFLLIFLAIISPIAGWVWAELMWRTFERARLKRTEQRKAPPENEDK